MNRKDVHDIIKAQAPNTQREFEKRSKDTIVQFAEQGLNAALFYENPDPRSYVSLVPTSAITGEYRNWKNILKHILTTTYSKVYLFAKNEYISHWPEIKLDIWLW